AGTQELRARARRRATNHHGGHIVSKFKVVVQKPAPGTITYDLAAGAYAIEREALDPIGAEIIEVSATTEAEFIAAAKDADAVIARNRRITATIIKGLKNCKVIGLGSVGADTVDGDVAKAVARRCHAFGLHVISYDPYVAELEMTAVGVEPVTSLLELCRRSDFLSMHAPLNNETHHMMSVQQFQAMKRTALFVNNGRGPTVDEPALTKALQEGWIAGAALDVFEQEPVDTSNALLKMDNAIVTPHIASATARMAPETRRRL